MADPTGPPSTFHLPLPEADKRTSLIDPVDVFFLEVRERPTRRLRPWYRQTISPLAGPYEDLNLPSEQTGVSAEIPRSSGRNSETPAPPVRGSRSCWAESGRVMDATVPNATRLIRFTQMVALLALEAGNAPARVTTCGSPAVASPMWSIRWSRVGMPRRG